MHTTSGVEITEVLGYLHDHAYVRLAYPEGEVNSFIPRHAIIEDVRGEWNMFARRVRWSFESAMGGHPAKHFIVVGGRYVGKIVLSYTPGLWTFTYTYVSGRSHIHVVNDEAMAYELFHVEVKYNVVEGWTQYG